jgi:hypothetical protein
VARLRNSGAEVGLREYLLEQAVDFRDLYGLVVDGAWEQLSKPVDQLLGGEAYRLYRWQLSDDYPAVMNGPISDVLTLTADDLLVDGSSGSSTARRAALSSKRQVCGCSWW